MLKPLTRVIRTHPPLRGGFGRLCGYLAFGSFSSFQGRGWRWREITGRDHRRQRCARDTFPRLAACIWKLDAKPAHLLYMGTIARQGTRQRLVGLPRRGVAHGGSSAGHPLLAGARRSWSLSCAFNFRRQLAPAGHAQLDYSGRASSVPQEQAQRGTAFGIPKDFATIGAITVVYPDEPACDASATRLLAAWLLPVHGAQKRRASQTPW
jgi:hypothetical protein